MGGGQVGDIPFDERGIRCRVIPATEMQSGRTFLVVTGRDTELGGYDLNRGYWSPVKMAGRPPAGTVARDLLVYAP